MPTLSESRLPFTLFYERLHGRLTMTPWYLYVTLVLFRSSSGLARPRPGLLYVVAVVEDGRGWGCWATVALMYSYWKLIVTKRVVPFVLTSYFRINPCSMDLVYSTYSSKLYHVQPYFHGKACFCHACKGGDGEKSL
jgi:hypothetical protein